MHKQTSWTQFATVMFSKLIWISINKLPFDKALSTLSKLNCADQVTLLSTLKWYLLFLFLQNVVVKSSSKYLFQSWNWFIIVSEIKKVNHVLFNHNVQKLTYLESKTYSKGLPKKTKQKKEVQHHRFTITSKSNPILLT